MDVPADEAAAGPERGYLDDRPFAASRCDLVAPARWALAFGALWLLPLAVRAGNAAGLEQALASVPVGVELAPGPLVATEQYAANAGAALFLLAGVLACTWLVRLQRVIVRANLLDRPHHESALWIMWGVPIASIILPPLRLARFDRLLHGGSRRSWAVYAWAVTWLPLSSMSLHAPFSGPRTDPPEPVLPFLPWTSGPMGVAWLRLGLAAVSFVLWAAVVVRLTRAGERTEAETTRVLRGQPSRSPSTSR